MPYLRGFPACDCLAAWLPAYEAELLARGIIPAGGALTIYQLIGGAVASGGTHATGGAFDVYVADHARAVRVARKMGADATWFRPRNWDGRGGMPHIHGVLNECPHNGPARYQIDAVVAGFNGLGKGGRGGPDDGPRPLFLLSWSEGVEWHRKMNRRRRIGVILKSLAARAAALRTERRGLPKP